jgi:hypothetical protein
MPYSNLSWIIITGQDPQRRVALDNLVSLEQTCESGGFSYLPFVQM